MSDECIGTPISWNVPSPIPSTHVLPPLFDNKCEKCKEEMERIPVMMWTRRRPYAVFMCHFDKLQLYIFESKLHPPKPLIIWSSECQGTIRFSERIDEIEQQREEARVRDEARMKELETTS
jgi:hypothetical protein